MWRDVVVGAGAVAAVASSAPRARAAEPPPAPYALTVGVASGYAAEAQTIWVGGVNKYRYGLGVRAGVSLPKLYLGVAFTHHFGTVESARGAGVALDTSYNATLMGGEVGYDAAYGKRVTFRPYVGGGLLFAYERTVLNASVKKDDHFRFHLTPGLLVTANLGSAFVGADFRVVMSPLSAMVKWAPAALATVGYRF